MFVCTGVGIFNRGIETFFRQAFDGLKTIHGLEIRLYKGAGPGGDNEVRVPCLPRTGKPARTLGTLIRRRGYVVEQLSFFPFLIPHLRRWRPHVVFYSDCNLAMRLRKYRHLIGVPYRLLYSNGAPLHPPFDDTDFVQHVTPATYQEALDAGEPEEKHALTPYGIATPPGEPDRDAARMRRLREQLGLPVDRPIVLSVGWISPRLKRMDFLVETLATLPPPRPFLVMLGAMDETSKPVLESADRRLGKENYVARSVEPSEVSDYYDAADLFVLCSLREGFGRVYLEALIRGLPCVVNDDVVPRFVLGEEGVFVDMTDHQKAAAAIRAQLAAPSEPGAARRRREHVRANFGWENLRDAYADMFQRAAAREIDF